MKAFQNKIILKGSFKESSIELPETVKNGSEMKVAQLKSLTVVKLGEYVKGLKEGDEVIISRYFLQDPSKVLLMYKDKSKLKDNEFYMAVEEEDIAGIY